MELDDVKDLARAYLLLIHESKRSSDPEMKALINQARTMGAVEMCVFCQELVSNIDGIHLASMTLTVLANRLLHQS